jgi:WD40 repeat protein
MQSSIQLETNVIASLLFSPKTGKTLVVGTFENRALLIDTHLLPISIHTISWLDGHTSKFVKAAYSIDELKVATCSVDRTARVFNANTGKLQFALAGKHTGAVIDVAFSKSPSVALVATGSHDMTAAIWNSDTGQYIRQLRGHNAPLSAVEFSVVSFTHVITASYDGQIITWDASNGKRVLNLTHSGPVYAMAISLDGSIIAGASDKISLWNTRTGALLSVLVGSSDVITKLVFSPDSQILFSLVPEDNPILWSVTNAKLIKVLQHDEIVTDIASRRDGLHITSSFDGIRIWGANGNGPVQPKASPEMTFWSMGVHPTLSVLLTGGLDSLLSIWEC